MPKDKKRKRNDDVRAHPSNGPDSVIVDVDTSKPSAVFTPQGGRDWTVSVAIAGSIIANAKSHDQKTYLAGSIARALAVFCVDEVVIFDDGEEGSEANQPPKHDTAYTAFSHPSHFLAHVVSFLETPPYLRKVLFPMHPNLRTAGTLPSLDMPHHIRANEDNSSCYYREGVSTGYHPSQSQNALLGTYVDIGDSYNPVLIPNVEIPPNVRLTVRIPDPSDDNDDHQIYQAVDPAQPRRAAGYYWGYTVRAASSLSAVLTECPFDGGYDLSIGTSERGKPLSHAFPPGELTPKFQHLLLVFGGVAGLEAAAANDRELAGLKIGKSNVGNLFDYWVNVLPGQGSRTIRTEEAVWLGLMGTRKLVDER